MTLRDKAIEFAQERKGIVVGSISGYDGPITFKVQVGDSMFHVYFARKWYIKYDGITIPKKALLEAIKENAMIVFFMNDAEYWKHSTEWMKGKQLTNSMYGTDEILCKKDDLEKTGIEFPKGIDSWT